MGAARLDISYNFILLNNFEDFKLCLLSFGHILLVIRHVFCYFGHVFYIVQPFLSLCGGVYYKKGTYAAHYAQ